MKNEIMIINEDYIRDKIYYIRGQQVMLDSDLAKIYGYSTKSFNRQIKNNIERFDDDFRFQLVDKEIEELSRSKNLTSMQTKGIKGGRTSNPYVFTENGIYMLMTVLKGEKAVLQSKALIRIFRKLKDFVINNNLIEQKYINDLVIKHDNKLIEHENKIDSLIDKFSTKDIFKDKMIFKGEFYDGYSLILDIFNKAKEEILIIDNYCDKKVLDIVCKLNIRVIVITGNMDKNLINKYQKQYNNLTIINDDSFHDRFIIIDKVKGYHLGSSIKDIGKKISYIDTIDKKWINNIIYEIRNI